VYRPNITQENYPSVYTGHNTLKLYPSVLGGHNHRKILISVKVACDPYAPLPFGVSEQQKIIILQFKATFPQPPIRSYQVNSER